MVSFGLLLTGVATLYFGYSILAGLRANKLAAKRANLPYLVVFVTPFNKLWQATHVLWVPIIQKLLPKSWWEDWLFVMTADWAYRLGQKPWERLGDTFLVVSPWSIILFTCNAEAIRQITSRRDDYPKPLDQYRILALYGDSVITTEGTLWRMHRKVTSAFFTERNAGLAFAESVHQARGMISKWRGADSDDDGHREEIGGDSHNGQGETTTTKITAPLASDSKTITSLPGDTMRLALHVIGSVGFGLRFPWPGQLAPSSPDKAASGASRISRYVGLKPVDGHTMTFSESLSTLLDKLLVLLLLPVWLLDILPFEFAKKALEAQKNYSKYMEELISAKKEEVRLSGINSSEQGMDIMGSLVRAKYAAENAESNIKGAQFRPSKLRRRRTPSLEAAVVVDAATTADEGSTTIPSLSPSATGIDNQKQQQQPFRLSDSDIVGNSFLMIVAGHETTANALHFALIELANHPASQRALQADVDRLLAGAGIPADAPSSALATLSHEPLVGQMLASMPGAVINETLRLMPAVPEIPKMANPLRDHRLVIDGEAHLIPGGTTVMLSAIAAHRNPRYWPPPPQQQQLPSSTAEVGVSSAASELNKWVPERWFRKSLVAVGDTLNDGTDDDYISEDTEAIDESTSGGDESSSASSATATTLFRPVRGSYIPFSDGARSCLGRRIAQVELMAALAVIFREYSVELAVDESVADDQKVERMADAERVALYDVARARSREVMRSATTLLTLKLPGESHVPVRIVRRGRERFINLVDV